MAPPKRPIARQSFELIAESIPHIVWLADGDGSTDYFNERGTDFTGLPRQANYGWKWLNIVHDEDAPRAKLGWEHSTRTATPFDLSYRLRRSDGEYHWHALRALPVRSSDGRIMKWIGTADTLEGQHHAARDDAERVAQQTRELRAMLAAIAPQSADGRSGGTPADRSVLSRRVNAALGEQPGRVGGGRDEPADNPVDPAFLAERDVAVLRLVAAGYTNAEVANLLGFSLRTIELRRAWLRERLGLHRRADFVRYAYDAGLSGGSASI